MRSEKAGPRGRGALGNPSNRFEPLHFEPDEAALAEAAGSGPSTRFYEDGSESIVTYNASPDLPFSASVNPYRGCEHGCAYCYARPTHEYLGFSAGLDFESKIMVKRRAAVLLKRELSSPRWKPQVIAMSGVTDPYQPVEKRLGLTRACLETLLDFRNPVGVVTKNRLVIRDADVLSEMAKRELCAVSLSITTLQAELGRTMEPRTSSPRARLETVSALASLGVPVGVFIAPVIPGLNDHEIPAILKAAREAGARYASYLLLRLPHGVKEVFFDWMAAAYPSHRDKVESRLRELRGGALNRSDFGERFSGRGVFAEQIRQLFTVCRRREGLEERGPELSTRGFRRPFTRQMEFGFE